MPKFYSTKFTSDPRYKVTLKGGIFQLKLLMAVALRARSKAASFVLNTEVVEAEKFDDLLVEYTEFTTVLQAKHSSKNEEYSKRSFFGNYREEASLAKYFDSFVRIRRKKLFDSKPVKYIFFTNRKIAEDDFYDCLEETEEPDKNLKFDTGNACCFKFKKELIAEEDDYKNIYTQIGAAITNHSKIYYELFSKHLQINMQPHKKEIRTAMKNLITLIVKDLKTEYEKKSQYEFKVNLTHKKSFRYRYLLLSVLQAKNEHTFYKFSTNFLNNENLTDFQKWTRKKFIKTIKQFIDSGQQEKQILKKIIFQFPQVIAQHTWHTRNEANNGAITKQNHTLTWCPNKEESYYLVGMFGEFNFKYNPVNKNSLPNLTLYKTLHQAIINRIKPSEQNKINEVEHEISSHLKDFLTAFRIKTGQPNEDELEKILYDELNTDFQFSGPEYYSQFFNGMLNWMKDINGKPINQEALNKFFSTISVGIERLHLTGYSQHMNKLLQPHDVSFFSENILNTISDFISKNTLKSHVMVFHSNDIGSLALAASYVVSYLHEGGILKDDNWGFVDPRCRILNKIPKVIASHCRLIIIDRADELSEEDNLLEKIVKQTIKHSKKLILLSATENKNKVINKCPKDNTIEYLMPNLSDDEVNSACSKHQDKYTFIAGRYIKISDILNARKCGAYQVMHSASKLMEMLQNTKKELPPNNTDESRIHITQQVKEYTAFYTMRDIIDNLPKQYLLTVFPIEDITTVEDMLPEMLLIDMKKLIEYLGIKSKEFAISNRLDLFQKCSINEHDMLSLKEYIKTNVPIAVDYNTIGQEKHITKFLKDLRQHHPIIVISKQNNITFSMKKCIYATLTSGKLSLAEKDRHLFQNPYFQLDDNVQPLKYDKLKLLETQVGNFTTCVTADPGTGKSQNFRQLVRQWSLSQQLKGLYHWVIMLNLVDINDQFLNRALSEVLIDYLCKTKAFNLSKSTRLLWIAIIEYDIENSNVKLLLDGWDEVKGEYESIVRQFIKNLPVTIHYDIAMRPYVFSSRPCPIYRRIDLQPFTEKDILNYLKNKFIMISDDKKLTRKKSDRFIQKTLAWLSECDQTIYDVVKTPLLTFILSEALLNDWHYWLCSDENEPQGPWNNIISLNLVTLYEIFILAKARIYLKCHVGITRSEIIENDVQVLLLVASQLEMMEEIAFCELFNTAIATRKVTTHEIHRFLLDFGVIVERLEEETENTIKYHHLFMHQTFKEFFAALFIVKALAYSTKASIYQTVFTISKYARFNSNYKVIWRFVCDLLEVNSLLLFHQKPVMETRTYFTTPKDQIGVAERNLLSQLGLYQGANKIHEMNLRSSFNTPNKLNQVVLETDDSLSKIKKMPADEILNTLKNEYEKDTVISLFRDLPNDIPASLINDYNEVLHIHFKSYWYRIYGYAAEKAAMISAPIDPDLVIALKKVASDDQCYESERKAAIRAMLKVPKMYYSKVSDTYLQMLLQKNIPNKIKLEILCCYESIKGVSVNLDEEISKKLTVGFGNYTIVDELYCELWLRERLVVKLFCNNPIDNHPDSNIDIAITNIVSNLTIDRVKLVLKLIHNGFTTIERLENQLALIMKTYDKRFMLEMFVRKFYDNSKEDELKFLQLILQDSKVNCEKSPVLCTAMWLLSKNVFEREFGENYYRFWRLDAGIPVAKFFLETPLKVHGLAYLIYQIRNNIYKYDVAKKISSYINHVARSSNVDGIQRCMVLYCTFEYLVVSQNQFEKHKYFEPLDSWPELINNLVKLAWEHFERDQYYPLIGLDVIFAIGVYYGLPLIHDSSQFKLLLVHNRQEEISSHKIDKAQKDIIEKYFKELRKLCAPSFRLNRIRDKERGSLTTHNIKLVYSRGNKRKLPTSSSYTDKYQKKQRQFIGTWKMETSSLPPQECFDDCIKSESDYQSMSLD